MNQKIKNKLLFLQLSRGANMERRSGLGYTPIHVTAHYDRVGVARLLLEAGVNPDEEDLQVSWFLQLRPSKFLPFPVTHYILHVFQKKSSNHRTL